MCEVVVIHAGFVSGCELFVGVCEELFNGIEPISECVLFGKSCAYFNVKVPQKTISLVSILHPKKVPPRPFNTDRIGIIVLVAEIRDDASIFLEQLEDLPEQILMGDCRSGCVLAIRAVFVIPGSDIELDLVDQLLLVGVVEQCDRVGCLCGQCGLQVLQGSAERGQQARRRCVAVALQLGIRDVERFLAVGNGSGLETVGDLAVVIAGEALQAQDVGDSAGLLKAHAVLEQFSIDLDLLCHGRRRIVDHDRVVPPFAEQLEGPEKAAHRARHTDGDRVIPSAGVDDDLSPRLLDRDGVGLGTPLDLEQTGEVRARHLQLLPHCGGGQIPGSSLHPTDEQVRIIGTFAQRRQRLAVGHTGIAIDDLERYGASLEGGGKGCGGLDRDARQIADRRRGRSRKSDRLGILGLEGHRYPSLAHRNKFKESFAPRGSGGIGGKRPV